MINPFNRPKPGKACLDDVLYWVWEREIIRMRKVANAEPPYTSDPILSKYRFCNVRRRDDRMSQWIMNNMLTPYTYNDGEDMWFVAAIARYVNWPPSLAALLVNGVIPEDATKFDPDVFVSVMDDLKEQGLKVWGSAYVIYPGRETGVGKAETVARKFLLPMAKKAVEIREAVTKNSVEHLVTTLSQFYGCSTFTAGQITSDLTYYPQELGGAVDLYSWAPIGPGSSSGLNILLGRPITASWKQEHFNSELVKVWKEVTEQLDLDNFTLHDQQNVFCEMSKYWRVLNGLGRPKMIYTPETAY